MNFWWVNHKQTAHHEIEGGYLWSPKRKKNGNRNHFYENMRQTRPGDVVVSYANARISHYGIVNGFPVSVPKPDEFGKVGENWSQDGWLVPVSWWRLASPFKPKDHIGRIRSFLAEKYAPIRDTGDGNQGAYLCKIGQSLIEELKQLGGFDPEQHAAEVEITGDEQIIEKIEDQIQKNIEQTLEETESEALIKARKGQGTFRRNVEKIESFCRVTRLEDKRLLIASHIKPWRTCETSAERLDGSNGLLLAPHVDRLFDKGLLSFERVGILMVSSTLDDKTLECLGLINALERRVGAFSMEQDFYLGYHRDKVFLP